MTFEDIVSEVKAGRFKPVYVLMGEETYFVDKLYGLIMERAVPKEERDFSTCVFDGGNTSTNEVINAARSYPMGDRMLVVVKNADELRDIDELAHYLKNPQPTTVLMLLNKKGTFDRRKKFMSMAEKIGVVFNSPKMSESRLPALVSSYFRQKGYSIDSKSVGLLVESVGNDLTKLHGEMNKLVGAVGAPPQNITPDVIEKHIGISKDFNIFEFQNALISKDEFKAFQIAKYFDENAKQNPIQKILPALFKFFSQLMVAHYAPAKDVSSLAKSLSMKEWQIERNILPALRNYSASKVLYILMAIRDADEKSKGIGGSKTPPGDLMKQLVFFILH